MQEFFKNIKKNKFIITIFFVFVFFIFPNISNSDSDIVEPDVSESVVVTENTTPQENKTDLTDQLISDSSVSLITDTVPAVDETTNTTTEQIIDTSSSTTDESSKEGDRGVLENIIDLITDIVSSTVDSVADIINATSTSTSGVVEMSEVLNDELSFATSTVVFVEEETDTGKLIIVSASNENSDTPNTNVSVFTSIPEIYNVGQEHKIQIIWKNNGNETILLPEYTEPKIIQTETEENSATDENSIGESIIETITETNDQAVFIFKKVLTQAVDIVTVYAQEVATTTVGEIIENEIKTQEVLEEQNLDDQVVEIIENATTTDEIITTPVDDIEKKDQSVSFKVSDTDGNGKLDRIEWIVPDLSKEQTYEIKYVSKVFKLDSAKKITEDIYDTLKVQDEKWTTIENGHYLKVTFNEEFDSTKDITIFAKPSSNFSLLGSSIEVYPVYTDANGNQDQGPLLGNFSVVPKDEISNQENTEDNSGNTNSEEDGSNTDTENTNHVDLNESNDQYSIDTILKNATSKASRILASQSNNFIDQEDSYKISLTNLATSTNTFYLKVSGTVAIDYISNPADNLTISNEPTENAGTAPNYVAGIGGGNINVDEISALLNVGKSVTIFAEGNIDINNSINKTEGEDATITLIAGNSIVANAEINSTSDIILKSENGNTPSGRIEIKQQIESDTKIDITSGVVMLDVDALLSSNEVNVYAKNILQQGTISSANINLNFTGAYIDREKSLTEGNNIYLNGSNGDESHIFASGKYDVSGTNGGNITFEALKSIKLYGAKLNASGSNTGGTIKIGGDFQGVGEMKQSDETVINPTTSLKANGKSGNGGTIVVWSTEKTRFDGISEANSINGNGGNIEISSKENLSVLEDATTEAISENGSAGTVLFDPKNIIISSSGSAPENGAPYYFELVDPNFDTGVFGNGVTTLSSGNVVVTDTGDDLVVSNAGAVYLFNGATGALISTLTGGTASDAVGSAGVTALTNGNYVVNSLSWDKVDGGVVAGVGAVTWGNGTTGIVGVVSVSNSLIGGTASDQVGTGVTALTNGNYVVRSTSWDKVDGGVVADVGAVTWGNGTTGIVGVVSVSNSLIGGTLSDAVGRSVTALTNGNYVVRSTSWDKVDGGVVVNVGAVTWGNGTTGIVGVVSVSNSLIGGTASDQVGTGVTALTNGNYVVRSSSWDKVDGGVVVDVGALTLGNGTSGTSGTISASNSITGPVAYASLSSAIASDTVNNHTLLKFIAGAAQKVYSISNNFFTSTPSDYTFAYDTGATYTLTPTFLTNALNAGTNVIMQASNDIAINSAVTANNAGGDGGDLTFQAGRSILINANITTDNGDLTLYANEKASTGVVDADRASGTAVITMAGGATLNTGTGTLTIRLDDGTGNTYNTGSNITLLSLNTATTTITNTNAGGNGAINSASTLGNLTMNLPGTLTLGGALEITGDLNIATGTLDVSATGCSGASCAISLGGNFINSVGAGGFNARAGTVTINNAGQIVSGTTTFNILAGSGSILEIPANVTVGTNNITITTNNGTIVNNLGSIGINNGTIDTNTFTGSGYNGVTGIVTGIATFVGNYTDNFGSTTGQLIRLFNVATTTARDFTTEGGRNDWILIAQGVIVDISSAIYNITTNVFREIGGGLFFPRNSGINGGASVVPIIDSTLPTESQVVTKWVPDIDFDDSTTCEYSYDNWSTTETITCSNDGSDIARPVVGTSTIWLRGADSQGNISEKSITFSYDNTGPTWTSCGTDLLDEAARPYYYLQDGAVTADCHFRVSTELRGAVSGTGILTGQAISDATSTDGYDITLRDITVTGTTTATTTKSGGNGGDIYVYDSTTKALITSGTSNGSGNGGNGGAITVATSTTGTLTANGTDGTGNGGNGGLVIITNSFASPTGSAINSNGGNSTSCGSGGGGGVVNIILSTYGTVTNTGGLSNTTGCPGSSFTPGSSGSVTVTGNGYVPPQTSTPAPTVVSNPVAVNSGTLDKFFTENIAPLLFKETPKFNIFNNSKIFKTANIGATVIPKIFKNLMILNSLDFVKVPTNFLNNVSKFVLNKDTKLDLFTVKSNGKSITTNVNYDKTTNAVNQTVKTQTNQKLDISLNTKEENLSGIFNGQTINLNKGNISITTPSTPGIYLLKVENSSVTLSIQATESAKVESVKKFSVWKWVKSWFR